MVYWKYLLPVFKTAKRTNYSIEAVNIHFQMQHLLSPRQAAELMWSRFVNTQGRQGCNIPCDLHMEHLNRRLKLALSNLGPNVRPAAIVRTAKVVGVMDKVCQLFEVETTRSTSSTSNYHTYPGFAKDYKLVVTTLQDAKVFTLHSGREHSTYNHKSTLLENFKNKDYLEWVIQSPFMPFSTTDLYSSKCHHIVQKKNANINTMSYNVHMY